MAAGCAATLYGLQTLSVSAGQSVEKGQAVGVLGEELTMDFKLGSKSVNPWPLFQTSGGLFWQEKADPAKNLQKPVTLSPFLRYWGERP